MRHILLFIATFQLASGYKDESSAEISLALLRRMPNHKSAVLCTQSIQDALALACNLASGKTKQVLKHFLSQAKDGESSFDRPIYSSKEHAHFHANGSAINAFIENSTCGIISDFVKENFSASKAEVILDTVCFRKRWRTPFEKTDFFAGNGLKTGHGMTHHNFTGAKVSRKSQSILVVSFPYNHESTSFYIFYPKEGMSFNEFLYKLDGKMLHNLIRNVYERQLNIVLPSFRIDTKVDGKTLLTSAGLGYIFNSNVDWLNVTKDLRSTVTQFVHKTTIEITELGTIAGAASAVIVSSSDRCSNASDPPPLEEVFVDRSFLFAVVQNSRILFIGQYITPTRES